MQPLRIFAIASLILALAAGASHAQRINAPGTYEAKIYADPNYIPPGFPTLDADLYSGSVRIRHTGEGIRARFRGVNERGEKLVIDARFTHGWAGMKLMTVPIDGVMVDNVIVGSGIASLTKATLNGVGTLEGRTARVYATFGLGGVLDSIKIGPAPGRR